MARNFFQKLLGIGNDEDQRKKREEELARAKQGIAPNQSVFNKLRDVVDPNTAADIARRTQAGRQAEYKSEVQGIGKVAKGFGKSVFEVGDTAVQGTRYGAGLVTGNRMARDSAARQLRDSASQSIVNSIYRPAEDMTVNALYKYPRAAIAGGNIFDKGYTARYNQALAETGLRPDSYVQDVVAPATETATNILGLGEASALGAGFKTAVKDSGFKVAAQQAAKPFVETQAYNAIQGANNELYKENPTIKGAVQGAVIGGVAGTAGDLLLAGVPSYLGANRATTATKSKAMDYLDRTSPNRPTAPKGFTYDPNGELLNAQGRIATTGEIQQAVQPKLNTQMETAINAGGGPRSLRTDQPIPNVTAPKPRIATKIAPDDQNIMADFIDSQRGAYKPKTPREQQLLELNASTIAEKYGLDMPNNPQQLADVFDARLQQEGFGKGGKTKYLAEDTMAKQPSISIKNEDLRKLVAEDTNPALKKSGFAKSVSTAQDLSPELKAGLKKAPQQYEAVTNKAQIEESTKLLKSKKTPEVVADVQSRLEAKLGTVDNQTVSDTIATIKRLDAEGGPNALRESTELTSKLSDHLTAAGQTVQAASLLGNRNGDGILFMQRKKLTQAGVDLANNPELNQRLLAARDAIDALPIGSEARNLEIAKMTQLTNSQIPSELVDKATTLWKAGLLTGIKTQTGNTLSGGASLVLKKASDLNASVIDQIAALFTGKRSKAFNVEGLGTGAKEGFRKGFGKEGTLRTGIDQRGLGFERAKFDAKQVNFGKGPLGRAAQAYTDTVFNLMSAADQPLYFASLRDNITELAKVEAKNQGLRGSIKDAFISNFKKNPPADAFQVATNAAEKATFANDTLLSGMASSVRNFVSDQGGPVANAGVNVVAPFTKVPSAVITRLFDYTPVGPIKLVAQQLNKKSPNVTQRQLVEALGEAVTGTGGLFLGAALAKGGLITGSYPEDPKERALWDLEGKKPNSIKFGNTWLSVNYTSPLGQILGTGARAQEAAAKGATGTDLVSQILAGAGKTVVDQSFLQGVSGGLDALTDPERSAGKFIKNQVASLVPTISGDVAKATDPLERQSSNPLEALLAKIPGARQDLNAKTDILGNDIKRPSSAINTIANPFRPSDIPAPTELTAELRRLQDAEYGVAAVDTSKLIKVGKGPDAIEVKMSPSELAKRNKEVGQAVQAQWQEIIKSPEYQALSDKDRQRALDNAESDIKAVKKKQILDEKNPEASAKVELTKNQQKLADGGLMTASSYAKPSEGAGSSDNSEYYKANDAEYNDKKSEYERKIKSGEYTKVGKIKAENELKKLEVGKDFSKDVRDLYSLSKTDLAALLESDPEGAKFAEQVIAYDKKLYDAGLIKYRKFKNGIAPSSGRGGGRGGSKGSKNWLPTSTTSKFNATSSSSAARKLLSNTIVTNTRKKKK